MSINSYDPNINTNYQILNNLTSQVVVNNNETSKETPESNKLTPESNKLTNYPTTNKSDRDVNVRFDEKKFNSQFIENDLQFNKDTNKMNYYDEISDNILPHQKPVQDIIINIREMFYQTLELLIYKKNPIPYILSTPDRRFSFSILLIVIGSLLLLFSNLMISSDEKK
jgi:hypothetical protein